MRVLTVVGARPQFVKAAPVSRALAAQGIAEAMVHTGQHYDRQLSDVFFEELQLRKPDHHLGVGSATHGVQTARMLEGIEAILLAERCDWVLVYGDTNSTLAGALAAAKIGIPVAHVEAGLRSFNRAMPEEINRVVADHLSALLFCPTEASARNLATEGITRGVHHVGDVMYDSVLHCLRLAEQAPSPLAALGLSERGYCLATIHRPANTDDPERLRGLIELLAELDAPVVLPLHPRTSKALAAAGIAAARGAIRAIEPASYLQMLILERHAAAIITDSGGIQKEACFFGVPCITLRPETEWVETVECGWNTLVDADPDRFREAVARVRCWRHQGPPFVPQTPLTPARDLFGDGHAAEAIAAILRSTSAV
jgi:UDP-N-acetylglucosamine 2-epimerase